MYSAGTQQVQTTDNTLTALLDSMLDEGEQQQAAKIHEPMGLDDFLNGLISETVQTKAASDRLKEARKTVKNTALPGSVIHKLKEEIRTLEYKAEWKAVADVIWIKRCVCDQCGSETPQFAGYFRKSHSRLSKAYRFTALSAEVESDLPREMKTEMTSVAMCADCIPQILMEDGWLTADTDIDSFLSDADEAESLAEEVEEETVEQQAYEGQEGNLIETEEVNDPVYKE